MGRPRKIQFIDNEDINLEPIPNEVPIKKVNLTNRGCIVVDIFIGVENYYMDDMNGVWNDKFQLIGAHMNNKIYLYSDIKKITTKYLTKKL
jgi:hypothetical protein